MKRREFTRKIGSALATGLAAPAIQISATAQTPAAGEKIVIGSIGVGHRGTALLHEFLGYDDVEVAAVCDLDTRHLGEAVEAVREGRGKKPGAYSDYRKLLEREDIDAVVIATPDHWHALPFIDACRAGKDVYVEKPLCHNWLEGKKMIEAAHGHGRVTQMGIQIHNHASRNYAQVARIVQSGFLGKISKVRCWKSDPLQGRGNPPDGDPPPELDYNTWLGPAPLRRYNPNRSHFNFRYFWDYSNGQFGDFGCHIMDVAYGSMKIGHAKSAAAAGGRFVNTDNTETPDTLEVILEYDDFTLVWSQTSANSMGFFGLGSIGAIFQGTEATLACNYSEMKIFSETDGERIDPPHVELAPHKAHAREFLDSVKSRVRCSCDVEYGHALTTNVHFGNIAYRTGTKVIWDPAREEFADNPAASALLSRAYRAPWKLA